MPCCSEYGPTGAIDAPQSRTYGARICHQRGSRPLVSLSNARSRKPIEPSVVDWYQASRNKVVAVVMEHLPASRSKKRSTHRLWAGCVRRSICTLCIATFRRLGFGISVSFPRTDRLFASSGASGWSIGGATPPNIVARRFREADIFPSWHGLQQYAMVRPRIISMETLETCGSRLVRDPERHYMHTMYNEHGPAVMWFGSNGIPVGLQNKSTVLLDARCCFTWIAPSMKPATR